MKIVKVSSTFPQWPLLQQTPQSLGVWGDYQFVVNQPLEDCDYWVVYDGLVSEESCRCCSNGAIFLTAEPPSVKRYSESFARQFSLVLTSHSELGGSRSRVSPPCLPWHVGRHVRA